MKRSFMRLVAPTIAVIIGLGASAFAALPPGPSKQAIVDFIAARTARFLIGPVTYAVATPALSMTGDTGTGISWSSAGLYFSINGNSAFAMPGSATVFLSTSNRLLGWSSGNADAAGADIALGRNAAGAVEVNNGTAGTYRDLLARSLRGVAVAFASLPTAVEGMMVAVTDSSTATWGATITGGGANHVLAYYNGTNWTVAGK